MKISILSFEGCPNHPLVVEMARRIVAEQGLHADIEEVEVGPDDVVRLRFLGSPTVQVDGVDIEPAARERADFAMSCRVYDTPDGLPSELMLRAALGAGNPTTVRQSGDRVGTVAIGGSVGTAMLSSACCWLPLLLLSFGASAAGASAFFERWSPAFIGLAIAGLALAFYVSYFRRTTCARNGCAGTTQGSRRSRKFQRGLFWVSALIVMAFIFFPNYIGAFFDGGRSVAVGVADVSRAEAREFIFDVEGMYCESCALTFRNELAKLEGVVEVRVDYASRTARVRAAGDDIKQRISDAASRAGYTATTQSTE